MMNLLTLLALALALGVLARDLRATWLRHARPRRSVPHIRP